MSNKRRRQSVSSANENIPGDSSDAESDDSTSIDAAYKLPRAIFNTPSRSLVCSLPPSCAPPRQPTILGSLRELEAHYAKYHTHICQEGTCRNEPGGAKIFPDARILALHQTEYHDELAALKNERGESIFACFLDSCSRKFRTPKGRRLHLIDAHGYPKLYFFAVTKHGIGGLLARYGEGATLIRKEWKPREEAGSRKGDSDSDSNITPTPNPGPSSALANEPQVSQRVEAPNTATHETHTSNDLEDLASSMKTLSLVPTSIRFGRGARRAGFVRRGAARGGISNVTPDTTSLRKREE